MQIRKIASRAMGHILLALAGILVVFCVGLYVFQSHLVYFPDRTLAATPHDIGLRYETVSLETRDGVKLSAWFVQAEKPRGVVLFCHGNGGNISHRLENIRIFNQMNLSALLFDYRGFGQSEGKPTEAGTYQDASAAWEYLLQKKNIAPERIILYGESLGGAIAAWLARERDPAALVLASAFISVPELASKLYPFLPVKLLSRFSYDTKAYLKNVHCPLLIVHSPDDEIVPYAHGRALYDAAKGSGEFLEIRGDHNSGFLSSEKTYTDGLNRFVTKSMGRPME
ncbi:MAG: alpha/beta hydrolase [Syntrophobacteraceae bacterium]